jgi:hypothetical protein
MTTGRYITVVSNDDFSYYIPMALCSWMRADADARATVFVRGSLNRKIRDFLKELGLDGHVRDNAFNDYPETACTCNAMRALLPDYTFGSTEVALLADVDMIFVKHKVSHARYYQKIMDRSGQPCAIRIAKPGAPKRPEITGAGSWTGQYTRVTMGGAAITQKWLSAAHEERARYGLALKYRVTDGRDTHEAGSYREWDEVMMYRICRYSGLKIPTAPRTFVDGDMFDFQYRDIHLGDFKFEKRWTNKKRMAELMPKSTVAQYRKMLDTQEWLEVEAFCRKSPQVKSDLKKLRTYIERAS